MSTTKVSIVLFADDVMLLAERKEDMETNLRELKKAMSNWGIAVAALFGPYGLQTRATTGLV